MNKRAQQVQSEENCDDIRRFAEGRYVDKIHQEKNFITLGRYAEFLAAIEDCEKAQRYFEAAMKVKPGLNSPEFLDRPKAHISILSNYAFFLDNVLKDVSSAKAIYDEILQYDPKEPFALGNYAMFCHRHYGECPDTIEAYKAAIDNYPFHSTILCKYAGILQKQEENIPEAEIYYKRATEASPENADVIGNYAIFLHNIKSDHDKAEDLYKQAISSDPYHSNNLGNYGLFLSDIRHNYHEAQNMYKRSLCYNQDNINSHYNYALLLHHELQSYSDAERHYRRALELDPKHLFSVYNYAVFKEDICQDNKEARELFEKALDINPADPEILADYAAFLTRSCRDFALSRKYYAKVCQLQPKDVALKLQYAQVALVDPEFEYGVSIAEELFQQILRMDASKAIEIAELAQSIGANVYPRLSPEKLYDRALNDTNFASVTAAKALYYEKVQHDYKTAEDLYKQALFRSPGNPVAVTHFVKFLLSVRKDRKRAEVVVSRAIASADPPEFHYRELLSNRPILDLSSV